MNFSSKISRYLKLTTSLLSLLILCSCVTTPTVEMAPAIGKTPMGQPYGTVIARVINASSWGLPFNYVSVAPKDLNVSEEVRPIRLESLNETIGHYADFASELPPGTYSMRNIRSYYENNGYWISRWGHSNVDFGTFTVEEGKVTNLGIIVYYTKTDDDRYYDTFTRIDELDTERFYAEHMNGITYDPEVLSWDEDDRSQDRESLFVSMLQNPTNFLDRYSTRNGDLHFLCKMGVIVTRKASGDWTMSAMETNHDVVALAESENSNLWAGTDAGGLFYSANGENWEPIEFSEKGYIEYINAENGVVDVLCRKRHELVVYRLKDNVWTALKYFTAGRGWNDGGYHDMADRITFVSHQEFKGKNYLFLGEAPNELPLGFGSRKIHKFTFEPSRWTLAPVEGLPEMDAVMDAGAVQLGMKETKFLGMDTGTSYFRYDEKSADWKRVAEKIERSPMAVSRGGGGRSIPSKDISFYFVSIPQFQNSLEGIAIVRKKVPPNYANENPAFFISTVDGGETWDTMDIELPNRYATSLIPEIKDRLLLGTGGITGDFWESTDFGRTWKHVRQQEVF